MTAAPLMRTQDLTVPEPPEVERASGVAAGRRGAHPPRPPAVRETASAIPERMVSLETRLAELLAEASAPQTAWPAEMASAGRMSFAMEMPSLGTLPSLETLSAAETSSTGETPSAEEMPSVIEMPAEEYATEEAPAGASAAVDANGVAEESALPFESADATAQQEELDVPSVAARVAGNPDWQALLSQLGVEIPGPAKGTRAESSERADETGTAEPSGPVAVEEAVPAGGDAVPAVDEGVPPAAGT